MAERSAPTGFAFTEVFPKTSFFAGDKIRFDKIEESLRFYRDGLSEQYRTLSNQANMTYKLWVGCVAVGFCILAAGLVLVFRGGLAEGAVTLASTVIVYFIQRVFHQREDHYRTLASEKNAHLEYGNQWLLIIQSIDAIEDRTERLSRQARLVDVLTELLQARKPLAPAATPRV